MAILQGARITGSIIATTFIKANGFSGSITASNLYVLGKAGIGTTSPVAKLSVYTTSPHASPTGISVAAGAGGANLLARDSGNYHNWFPYTDGLNYYSADGHVFRSSNHVTNNVNINSNGNVGIGTSSPLGKLHVIETTATGSRIQLGTNSENALMDANKTVDMLILNAPYGTNSATTSNAGAKWGIKFVGSLEAGQINTIGKTSAIYAVSEDTTAGYNRGTSLAFYTNQFNDIPYAERMRISHNGNVGIGTTAPAYKLQVSGSFAATTKSFVINHPDPAKSDKQLQHGVTEAAEHTVFVRGKLTNNNTIELPDYWPYLVDDNTITVTITPVGSYQQLYVQSIQNNKVTIANNNNMPIHCYYYVVGERKDIPKLIVEL